MKSKLVISLLTNIKLNLVLILFLTMSACATYRISHKLDKSLNENGIALAKETQLILDNVDKNRVFLSERTEGSFSQSGVNKLTILSVEKKIEPRERGFQCWEPLLHILSIGLIPSVCEQEYRVETQWKSESGNVENKTYNIHEKQVVGWVSIFINLFPNWKIGTIDTVDSVIYTEVNAKAK